MPGQEIELSINAHDPESLRQTAARLADLIRPPLLVLVRGNLGAGKTTLIAAILSYWGVHGANSPSFNLRNDYAAGAFRVIHLDFYRLRGEDAALDLLPPDEDYSNAVVFAEWPEKAPQHLYAPFSARAELFVSANNDETRLLRWVQK